MGNPTAALRSVTWGTSASTSAAPRSERRGEDALRLRRDRGFELPVESAARDPEAKAAERGSGRRFRNRPRPAAAGPRHHRVEEAEVGDRPRDGTGGVAGVGDGDDPRSGVAADRGAKAREAAEGRGEANGAAGVGPDPGRHHARRDRGGGPAARAAGDHRQVPGVAGRAGDRVVVRDAEGKLVHVRLGPEERARVEEGGRNRRVPGRGKAGERAGGATRRERRRFDVVLEGERHAGERAAGAVGIAVHGPRRRAQRIEVMGDEGVEAGHRLRARDERLDVLAAGARALAKGRRGLRHGQLDEVGVPHAPVLPVPVHGGPASFRGTAPAPIVGAGAGSPVSSFLTYIARARGTSRQ